MSEQFKPDPGRMYKIIHGHPLTPDSRDLLLELSEALTGVKPEPPPKEPEMPEPAIGQVWEINGEKRVIVCESGNTYSFTCTDHVPFNCFGIYPYTELKEYLKIRGAICLGMAKIVLPDTPAT